jgi:hypothetical protein
MIPEDPEDSSDLESEEEMGRTVRTTFIFNLKAFILEEGDAKGYITKALLNIHSYTGDLSEYKVIENIEIT